MVKSPGLKVLYWFRTDLRLHDSPALQHALSLQPSAFYPVFTFDSHYVIAARGAANRWQYLLDCMSDLSASLARIGGGHTKLIVLRGKPETVLPLVVKAWGIDVVCWEEDSDAYAAGRDERVRKALLDKSRSSAVKVETREGRTLWPVRKVAEIMKGQPTMSMASMKTIATKLGPPAKPLPAPAAIIPAPEPGLTKLMTPQLMKEFTPPTLNLTMELSATLRTHPPTHLYDSLAGPNGGFAIPTLTAELGLPAASTPHRGGETLGLDTLAELCGRDQGQWVATFSKPETPPTKADGPGTMLLSAHIHFGSVSVREVFWRVKEAIEQFKRSGKREVTVTPIPTNIEGQLMFRDMYFHAYAALGESFSHTIGNRTAKFIPWHLPTQFTGKNNSELATCNYLVDNSEAEMWFRRWKNGRTGFPWIDALMRQLRYEGWIHHLGRHAVACFLTRGGCFVHWERGAEVFASWLIDHEPASNAGNWQWLSCTAFFSQYYRVYSPTSFPTKWDKSGKLVRKWCPELSKYGDKYIYEPWKAPIADQKAWGCLVQGDGSGKTQEKEGDCMVYPKPMFDFAERRGICLDAMKKAYGIGLHGNDEQVLDGTWRKLFDDDDVRGFEYEDLPVSDVDVDADGGEENLEPIIVDHLMKRKKTQGTLDGMVKRVKK